MNKPYISNNNLIIPVDSDEKYKWWNPGADGRKIIENTLSELGRPELAKNYIFDPINPN